MIKTTNILLSLIVEELNNSKLTFAKYKLCQFPEQVSDSPIKIYVIMGGSSRVSAEVEPAPQKRDT
jgi:hypothetical protein